MGGKEELKVFWKQKCNRMWDQKTKNLWEGGREVQHYVGGGPIPESALISQAGGDGVEYRRQILENYMKNSGLSLDEIEAAIDAAPDHIEGNPNKPNSKPLYYEALKKLREKRDPSTTK